MVCLVATLTSVLQIQFSFVMLFSASLNPETYAPVLLRRRAAALQKETGKVYRSMYDLHPMFAAPFAVKMKAALLRPFLLLIKEPICSLFALYTAAIYGFLCQSSTLLHSCTWDRRSALGAKGN